MKFCLRLYDFTLLIQKRITTTMVSRMNLRWRRDSEGTVGASLSHYM